MKRSRTQLRRSILALLAAVGLGLAAVPSTAINSYIVNLKNGSTIISKYRPVESHFDESLMMLMTAAGNTIAIPKADIDTIVSDLENRGFGVVIDTTTVVVGRTANDASVESEEAILSDLSTYSAINNILNITGGFNNTAGFSSDVQPASPAGSIPLNFVSSPGLPVGPVSTGSVVDEN